MLDRLPGQISEGEKQRVAVARAIVRDPNCFLFDEPLSRLDVELRQTMRGQIKEVLTGLSKATVIVTHDQLEALTMANRIAIMKDGLIEQIGTPHDVFAKPANLFVASFIGTPQMNLIPAAIKSVAEGKVKLGDRRGGDRTAGGRCRHAAQAEEVTIGIRPRALLPVSGDRAPIRSTSTVELIEPMGAETLIHARGADGQDLRVVVPREKRVKIGEKVRLACDPTQTHIFDSNGQAVRA